MKALILSIVLSFVLAEPPAASAAPQAAAAPQASAAPQAAKKKSQPSSSSSYTVSRELLLPSFPLGKEAGKDLKKATEKLRRCAAGLDALLDREAMEKEVSKLVEMTEEEKKTVGEALEEFRGHWTGKGKENASSPEAEDPVWFEKVVDKATDPLDAVRAGKLAEWLVSRKRGIEAAIEKIGEAAAEVGRAVSQVTAGDWARWSADLECRIARAVERSLAGIGSPEMDEESLQKAIQAYSERVQKYAEQMRKTLDLRRGVLNNRARAHFEALLRGFRAGRGAEGPEAGSRAGNKKEGEKDSYDLALEAYRRALDNVRKSLGSVKDYEKRLEKLEKSEESLKSRDEEIRALKKEIEDLKKEIEDLKRKGPH